MDHRHEDGVLRGVHGDPVAAARRTARAAMERAAQHDCDGGFPAADIDNLARAGLLAAPVPRDYGGAGLGEEPDASALRDVLTWVGYGSLALGRVYEGHVNALQLVARFGDDDQCRRLFADAQAGHLFGVWNTQPATGGLAIVASGDRTVLQGCKTFASGAGFVTRPLVTAHRSAADGSGASLMVVADLEPGERADLSAWRAHGMRASATGTLDFTGLSSERWTILGASDDYFAQPHFSGGAWRFLAVQLGGLHAILDVWRDHLRKTGRGADPHQLARLGEGAIAAETARLWVIRAAAAVSDAYAETADTIAYVNLARLAVERAGLDLLELAQRSIGLQGFLRDHPLERLVRDLATYLRQPAPDRALVNGAEHVLTATAASCDLWSAETAP